MIRRIAAALFIVLAFAITSAAQQPKALFYMTRDPSSVRSFFAHANKIDLLVPAWYGVDSTGLVSGGPDPAVLTAARDRHVVLMPLVANAAFVQEDFHKLLINPAAYREMFSQLIRACKDNGYIGIQFDFENVNWTDRESFSTMVREGADAFHSQKLQLSIATVPNAPGAAGESGFSAWLYENWRGAYDLKSLAQSVDFICLMTYDQHTRWTAPGPVAGWQWTIHNLDYAAPLVPREKLFLGIPLYGYRWFAGTPAKPDYKPNPSAVYIATTDALDLARSYDGHVEWDPADWVAWFYFYRDDMREWIFFTDARGFRERYMLAKDRGLGGFCSWALGMEDPGIWDILPSHQ